MNNNFEENVLIFEKTLDIVTNFLSAFPKIAELENMKTYELYVFLLIGRLRRTTAKELLQMLRISKANLSLTLTSLREKELLFEVRDSQDRRVVLIDLSEKGKKLYKRFLRSFDKISDSVINQLSMAEKRDVEKGFELIFQLSRKVSEDILKEGLKWYS